MSSILSGILQFVGNLLQAFGFSSTFLTSLDSAFAWFVGLIQSAGYFMPLDVFMVCLGVMLVVDNWVLLGRVGTYILKLLRG